MSTTIAYRLFTPPTLIRQPHQQVARTIWRKNVSAHIFLLYLNKLMSDFFRTPESSSAFPNDHSHKYIR